MFKNKKIIFIFGFHHSGTTMLRTTLSHIDNSYTIIEETDPDSCEKIIESTNYKYYILKNPEIKKKYFQDKYNQIYKIFLIRNPLCVISSCNKRYPDKLKDQNYVSRNMTNYLDMVKAYCLEDQINNMFHLKYENMFLNQYQYIKEILNKISIDFTDMIFDNTLYCNISHRNQTFSEIPATRPQDIHHKNLRLYQINQQFINNNDYSSLYLNKYQLDSIMRNNYITQIYPEINSIIINQKINIIKETKPYE